MSYVATAVTQGKDGWIATELDLRGLAEVEEVTGLLQEVDPEAEVSLLFVESDDVYFTLVRLDQGEDPRIFSSDAAFARESRLGSMLLRDVEVPALEIDEAVAAVEEDEANPVAEPVAEPVGDADLLADLGMSAHILLEVCGREGMLPSDVTAEVAQAIGCGDELEELRET